MSDEASSLKDEETTAEQASLFIEFLTLNGLNSMSTSASKSSPLNILSAQERTITGTVVDGSMGDDPLPGATVSITRGQDKKVTHGTVTDYDGKFTLKVDAKDKTFSYARLN